MQTTCSTHFKPILNGFLFVLLLVSSLPAGARHSYPSIGLRTNISGDGLAAAPAITLRYSFEKFDIDLGANLQLRGLYFSGVQGSFCRYVTLSTRKVRLGFFTNVRYHFAAGMSRTSISQEKYKQPESTLDFEALRLRTIEGQAGFAVRIQHALRFSSFYGIGVGAYQTLGDVKALNGMHREINRAQLVLNFGISFSFRQL